MRPDVMLLDHLYEDYKVRVEYLRHQYDRLWQRFHYFLSVELALFGVLGYFTFTVQRPEGTYVAAALGIGVSLLWYAVGAEDRALVETYGARVGAAARRVTSAGWEGFETGHAAAPIPWKRGYLSFYRFHITQLPVFVALVLLVLWLAVLVAWNPVMRVG